MAKVRSNRPLDLVTTLFARGVGSRELAGGWVVVRLPRIGFDRDIGYLHRVPAELQPKVNRTLTIAINCVEQGGAEKSGGAAMIICGVGGQPIRPFWKVEDCGTRAREHARFCINEESGHPPPAIATVEAFWRNPKGKSRKEGFRISEYRVVHVPRTGDAIIALSEQTTWEGIPSSSNVPPDKFGEAVLAALAKATCVGCREPHFVPDCRSGAPLRTGPFVN